MTVSSLATVSIPSPNRYWGRAYPVTKVTIHHMGGNCSVETCGGIFLPPSRKASSNYGVGSDGRIACYVDEDDAAWTSANWDNDNRAITIEVADFDTSAWSPSDAAYEATIDLCADICTRYGIVPSYTGDTSGTFTEHMMFSSTSCVPVDSEVLTRHGWVKLSDVSVGDEIACATLDDLSITFDEVQRVVPVKRQDTYTNHGLTATKDHRIVYAGQYNKNHRIDFYSEVLRKANTNQVYVPLAGTSKEEGVDLTDDMIRFYVAVQADGHYMYDVLQDGSKSYYGLEFHFAKKRKIERIKGILDAVHLNYSETNQSNGTAKIRVYNSDGVNIVNDICEKWLSDKCFTWEWLKLSQEQSELFLSELMLWDGCEAGKKYSSRKAVNLDVVNAVAATHGVGSRVIGCDVQFRDTPYTTLRKETKRHSGEGKWTTVSCVTVNTGIFLVRQDGKTFIIGNCPGPWWHARMAQVVEDVKARMAGETEDEEEGCDMQAIYRPDGKNGMVWFDGSKLHALDDPDEMEAVKAFHRKCVEWYKTHDEEEIPVFEFGTKEAPWAHRFEDAVQHGFEQGHM